MENVPQHSSGLWQAPHRRHLCSLNLTLTSRIDQLHQMLSTEFIYIFQDDLTCALRHRTPGQLAPERRTLHSLGSSSSSATSGCSPVEISSCSERSPPS